MTWFTAYCDQRFRYFHANNPRWRKWLEDRDRRIDPRDQCKVWIRHWLTAYVLDPAGYQERYPSCLACGNGLFGKRQCDACGFKSKTKKQLASLLTYTSCE